MRRFFPAALFTVTALLLAVPAMAEGKSGWSYDKKLKYHSGLFHIEFENRLQARVTAEDPELGDSAQSFDIARYKFGVQATISENWLIGLQADLANGSETSAKLLEDAYVMFTKKPLAQLWVGQGKVLFGRQDLISSGKLQFIERSAVAEEFRHNPPGFDNRDVGIALLGQNGNKTYNYGVGVYNGNGTNKDAKDNSDYMITGRLVVTPLGEFELSETDLTRSKELKLAVGVSVMTVTRGTEALAEKTRDVSAGLEFALRKGGGNLIGEFFTRSEDAPLALPDDEIDTDGWYIQGGYLFASNWEVAGRYGRVIRDVVNDDETEWGISGGYYFAGHHRKIQADYRQLDFEGPPSTPDIDRKLLRVQLQLIF